MEIENQTRQDKLIRSCPRRPASSAGKCGDIITVARVSRVGLQITWDMLS